MRCQHWSNLLPKAQNRFWSKFSLKEEPQLIPILEIAKWKNEIGHLLRTSKALAAQQADNQAPVQKIRETYSRYLPLALQRAKYNWICYYGFEWLQARAVATILCLRQSGLEKVGLVRLCSVISCWFLLLTPTFSSRRHHQQPCWALANNTRTRISCGGRSCVLSFSFMWASPFPSGGTTIQETLCCKASW